MKPDRVGFELIAGIVFVLCSVVEQRVAVGRTE